MAQQQTARNPFSLIGHKKAVPSADDLLSLKLLAENDAEFAPLKEEATIYLKSAMKMLSVSPFLRSKLGGDGIAEASVLAELVKQRADTLNFQLHIDDLSRQMLSVEFAKNNMKGLHPAKLSQYDRAGAAVNAAQNMIGAPGNAGGVRFLNADGTNRA